MKPRKVCHEEQGLEIEDLEVANSYLELGSPFLITDSAILNSLLFLIPVFLTETSSENLPKAVGAALRINWPRHAAAGTAPEA